MGSGGSGVVLLEWQGTEAGSRGKEENICGQRPGGAAKTSKTVQFSKLFGSHEANQLMGSNVGWGIPLLHTTIAYGRPTTCWWRCLVPALAQ